jgi:hypothetical protein
MSLRMMCVVHAPNCLEVSRRLVVVEIFRVLQLYLSLSYVAHVDSRCFLHLQLLK